MTWITYLLKQRWREGMDYMDHCDATFVSIPVAQEGQAQHLIHGSEHSGS